MSMHSTGSRRALKAHARTKKLTPGKYTLVITAITPGVGATSQTLRFSIVR